MRICLMFVVVGLAGAWSGPAGDLRPAGKLKIEGETSYAPFKLVRLKAVGLPEGALIRWRVTPGEEIDYATTPRNEVVFIAPEGVYQVELTAVKGSGQEAVFDEARVEVEISSKGRTRPK